MAAVSAIFIYPIKSCRGISVPQAPLTPTGKSPLSFLPSDYYSMPCATGRIPQLPSNLLLDLFDSQDFDGTVNGWL